MPLRGRAHDDVDSQAEALGDGTFEQRANFVGLQVGIDNQVAALDIGLRTLQADFDGERPQLGHRQLARRADIDAAHQRHEGFHRSLAPCRDPAVNKCFARRTNAALAADYFGAGASPSAMRLFFDSPSATMACDWRI